LPVRIDAEISKSAKPHFSAEATLHT
jgi:hypothetical protein